jgi:cyclic beta-1,2-glucan synthetase
LTNVVSTTAPELNLRRWSGIPKKASPWDNETPVREELFSVERLETHARSLAVAQIVAGKTTRGLPLSARLADNGAVLLSAYRSIVAAIDEGRAITPASEWLIDNYHLVERQVRQISTDLPPGYYRQLPKLVTGPFAGYPRVFGLAWAFVAHTDSCFDSDILAAYINAYQEVQPLTIGELWAVSMTLQIVLIENLRRLAQQITVSRTVRREADRLADRLLGVGGRAPEPASIVFADRPAGPLPEAFAVQLVHRLREQDPKFTPALAWLDERLAKQDTTADSAVREVHRSQGAANVTVRNIVTSLRGIVEVDWKELFERYCLVDGALAKSGGFSQMDFATRTLYRSAVEELARGSLHDELNIARLAVAAADAPHPSLPALEQSRRADSGYYLLAGGRREFEASIGFRRFRFLPARATASLNFGAYAGSIVAMFLVLLIVPIFALAKMGVGAVELGLLALVGAIPAIDIAVAVVNRIVTSFVRADALPALALRDGVPATLRTLVAVPTLLTTRENIAELVERLEIHHLASPEGDLHFALLSDWIDADVESAEGDAALVEFARKGIDDLNKRYGPAPAGPRFFLLHRRRVWSETEARWIGWERKRGKLHELNRLLRGATDTTFVDAGEATGLPAEIRYVITLDSDTQLPRDAVGRLIGKMAHPLNRPRLDIDRGAVVEGYGVLQPRVTPALPSGGEGSLFQRLFSNASGIDPYSSAISEVYQDMFGEGSYAGKGIYDIDAFEAVLAGRAPDSTLLSHDLFEGTFARAGFASDVEVVEDFPSRYDVNASRHHRWARGDWQLLPWILGFTPKAERAAGVGHELPQIGRWKMIDNLRRTLSAPTAVLALMLGWTLSPQPSLAWTAFVLATIVLPNLIPVISSIPSRGPGVAIFAHVRALGEDLRLSAILSAMNVTFLADQAWLMADAIARTLWRIYVSRRHLLEWTPAAQTSAGKRLDLQGYALRMAGALGLAVAALLIALVAGHGAWPIAAPFVALWLVSPAAARFVSSPPVRESRVSISEAETKILRQTARRTWRYFETFVSKGDNDLPPDNFQETPTPAIAHRTSPTNIGLYLLSVVSARDFGWIGVTAAIERLEATLATMSRMQRFRGHFYNWYDTRELRVLDPKYVSSVDSGNLAGHLIALANACREWRLSPSSAASRRAGLADTLALAAEEAVRLRAGRRTQTVTPLQLEDSLAAMSKTLASAAGGEETSAADWAKLADDGEILIDIVNAIALERNDGAASDLLYWSKASLIAIAEHRSELASSAEVVASRVERLIVLEDAFRAMAMAMEFGFLFDKERQLLSIGYLIAESALDPNCYDLLASEARLASFFAIAKGDIPARHWFRLGRAATQVARGAALISWSGSMFEYLMPPLVMRAPAGSLLEQTDQLVVRRQIEYGAKLGLPWGISESAYNARDLEFTYQYSNFGVPGLGLKRGLGENRVVAPYATGLAAMVDPSAAVVNLNRLTERGARGRHGFYEAVDFTPTRVQEDESFALVRSFMAHHQGMTIVAIANALFDGAMRTRFHAEPVIRATELLLQERVPREVASTRPWAAEVKSAARASEADPSGGRKIASPHQSIPSTLLLSNGRYAVMMTAAGSGYSRWGDMAITRWREDATRDDSGSYIFLRDLRSGALWSAGVQPTGAEPEQYSVLFNEDRAEFTRRDGALTTTLDVLVSAEDDAEVRRVTITNAGVLAREIEVTSYLELSLGPQSADVAHPAFAKLFVETEYLVDLGAIVATRRKRTPTEPEIWAAHLSVANGESVGKPEFETDRARFLGRGHGVSAPIAMLDARPLTNSIGTVLDPVFALRRRVRVAPGATVRVAFWTMAAGTRAALLDQIDKHHDSAAYERATTLAWTQAQVQLHHLGVKPGEAELFQRLASHVIYASPAMRPSSDTIRQGSGPQFGLWSQGISGDLPIVLLRISDIQNLNVARQMLQAHEYWLMKQLAVDLVILNERRSSYVQDLQIAMETLVRASQSRPVPGVERRPGRAFVLRADLVDAPTRSLLISAARVVITAQHGSLSDQLDRSIEASSPIRLFAKSPVPRPGRAAAYKTPQLEFFNGLGGFGAGGKEYVTILGPGQSTPAPWINVIANSAFGFQVATEGGGYTWSANSRENQLTPWSNDPVSDPPGEAFYLRDEISGEVWSPTALPIRDPQATYVARHGRGYSRFEHESHGIAADLVQFAPLDGSIKISRLRLTNPSGRARHLSVTAFVEWTLAASRSASLAFVETEKDFETGAILARNPWNTSFGSRVAFADMRGAQSELTGDRREFIGRNRTLANPAAMTGATPLSNKVGAGLDPCAAMRAKLDLPPGGAAEIVFFLGDAATRDEARATIKRYRTADLDAVEAGIASFWAETLGAVVVKTPDRSMDIMLNGWLLYQTLACRVWARSAFYQASGAYGFRDQLQDGMALAAARPDLTREHLLRATGRQFVEGDVQHWWLPHSGQGVRTRISDDRPWLAFAVAQYVKTSGDARVLDESVAFLEGAPLAAEETDNFFLPIISKTRATLFEHCALALDQSLALGRHGLPLMGTGDWNDGMNRVGEKGEGESVWLGWFLHTALTAFAPLALARNETARAEKWTMHADALKVALEREAWDGDWYTRAYFDDGAALGAAADDECRIDSIAQSWAVLSGAATPGRAARAMAALDRELIRRNVGLALLFAPPFDKTALDPGYIKGYPPGVRENGGQYTHAATWSVMAFAALGDGDKAGELFAMLNPINHARTRAEVHRYKVEPYVVCADIYSAAPHVGRGGWTWYTGSAGWMQRAGVESLLGLRLLGATLCVDPCIPKAWGQFDATVKYRSARYSIHVENPGGVSAGVVHAEADGVEIKERPLRVPLLDDESDHQVHVRLG